MTQRFTWNNENGQSWRDILSKTARSEFEMIKGETDTVKLSKFVITWRDAVMRIHEKVSETQMKMISHVQESRTDLGNIKEQRNDYTSGGGALYNEKKY